MKVLMVLTSHSELGNTGLKTGFWIEEFAAPYYVLEDAGIEISLASPKGGQPPMDPKSDTPEAQTPATERFHKDLILKEKLSKTLELSTVVEDDYDALFYPGGHGPLWDLAGDEHSIFLLENYIQNQKPIALVCHAPAALVNVKNEDGEFFIKGKKITGFSDSEEEAVKLTQIVPFLLEDRLKELGGIYSKGPDWGVYVIQDGNLITGQNPASSEEAARILLKKLDFVEEMQNKGIDSTN